MKKLINLYDTICIWIWFKLMIRTEEFRLKAESWTYTMDSKIKDR